jgi:aspartate dehydrogenase
MTTTTVAVVGLGAIGLAVAKGLDKGIPGLDLIAVTDRDLDRATAKVANFKAPPAVGTLESLWRADVIVEAAGASVLPGVVDVAIRHQRLVLACSVGALLTDTSLVERAARGGTRIIVPSGALGGLDAVRAAAEGGEVHSVTIATRKPPAALAGAPYIREQAIDLDAIAESRCIFRGTAREAAAGFPANLNVAAALALAGIGPDRTLVEIWADPEAQRNVHTVTLDSAAVRLSLTIEGLPSPGNPRTSQLTYLSVLATLRGLVSPLRIGA